MQTAPINLTTPTPKPTPAQAIDAWPESRGLVALLAGDATGRSRYSLLAEPLGTVACATLGEAFDLIATTHEQTTHAQTARTQRTATPGSRSQHRPGTGWIASFDYAAGFEIEQSARTSRACIQRPAAILARVDRGWVHDNLKNEWSPLCPDRDAGPLPSSDLDNSNDRNTGFSLGDPEGLERRTHYERAVARAVGLIHAGDVFQVNLTHRLSAAFRGSPRSLFAHLAGHLAPWHGCYIEHETHHGTRAIASASPELFLELGPTGKIVTRPMKGTRAAHDESLEDSAKDAAELAMIVDLMRNDLGRVCEFGSVRVESPRTVERHGPEHKRHVVQGVATVSGQVRTDLGLRDIFEAAFPPGSITGAPKVRAMQIIDEIEQGLGFIGPFDARGPYCGACGFIGDDGSASLNVAIRTAIVERGRCHYPVGAGIVADSDPQDEWHETLIKAKPFLELCGHDDSEEEPDREEDQQENPRDNPRDNPEEESA